MFTYKTIKLTFIIPASLNYYTEGIVSTVTINEITTVRHSFISAVILNQIYEILVSVILSEMVAYGLVISEIYPP